MAQHRARSGTSPACRLAPAIQFIGYDGYPGHGSPRTCTGGCPAHLHLSWASPCYGTSRLAAPCEWVMAFAVLPADYASFLNRIESHFWAAGEFVVKNADHPDWDTLAKALADYIGLRNRTRDGGPIASLEARRRVA